MTRVVIAGLCLSVSCTYVDDPGSTGPDRTPASVTTTLAQRATDEALHCLSIPEATEPPPDTLIAAVDAALAHPGWRQLDRSISVWIEDYGEVAAIDADQRLLPASNQKLFTAFGAFLLLDLDQRFVTEVRQDEGRLTLVAGGDPTLTRQGSHSLAALARQVRSAGVSAVDELSVDASHFEYGTSALGWQDWHIPTYVGPLSAFTVDDNRYRRDDDYLFNPAVGNLETFRDALTAAGVSAAAATLDPDFDSAGDVVASVASAPVGALLAEMLTRSDNETAEAILREIGRGSTTAGVQQIDEALDSLCTGRSGQSGDGSGLSRENLRSAREWRSLLQAAAAQPWGEDLVGDLAVAGRTGTLARRLTGADVTGNVTAKTGSIIGGRSLSGYATRVDGRAVVFSIVVNGDPGDAAAAAGAIDALVVAVVTG